MSLNWRKIVFDRRMCRVIIYLLERHQCYFFQESKNSLTLQYHITTCAAVNAKLDNPIIPGKLSESDLP